MEKPEPPKDEFPKFEEPKPEIPKCEPPKFVMEFPEENDENDENRDDGSRFAEKRFELNPGPDARVFDEVARFGANDENPERSRPKETFPEFPKERHWLSFRMEFP